VRGRLPSSTHPCSIRNEARNAAVAPNNPTPTSMRRTATARPTAVVGKASPYPTVLTRRDRPPQSIWQRGDVLPMPPVGSPLDIRLSAYGRVVSNGLTWSDGRDQEDRRRRLAGGRIELLALLVPVRLTKPLPSSSTRQISLLRSQGTVLSSDTSLAHHPASTSAIPRAPGGGLLVGPGSCRRHQRCNDVPAPAAA
jgi:hypothetical protein